MEEWERIWNNCHGLFFMRYLWHIVNWRKRKNNLNLEEASSSVYLLSIFALPCAMSDSHSLSHTRSLALPIFFYTSFSPSFFLPFSVLPSLPFSPFLLLSPFISPLLACTFPSRVTDLREERHSWRHTNACATSVRLISVTGPRGCGAEGEGMKHMQYM